MGDTEDPDRSDVLRFNADPGTGYAYSGEAYELLRKYVEHKTQRSLGQLFRDRLGAKMSSSSFAPPLARGVEASRGYVSMADADSGRDIRFQGGAAGGLVTTASDYARFVEMVCRGEGLSSAAYAAMLRPVVEANTGRVSRAHILEPWVGHHESRRREDCLSRRQ